MATKKVALVEETKVPKVKVSKLDFAVPLEELLDSGAHFGHLVKRWNPKMKKYIYMERDGVHIFDLAKTAEKLREACEYLYEAAKAGKSIIMVGTKRQAAEIIQEVAEKAGIPYISERWMGGIITNWEQISKRIKKLGEMVTARDKGEFNKYTKKERLLLDREIIRLQRFFGGLTVLKGKPEVLFIVDTHKERVAVREATSKGVIVVGITDTNANPDLVDYPIPANDDAIRSVKLIVEMAGKAIGEGQKLAVKAV